MWAASIRKDQTIFEGGFFYVPISFSIPLGAPLGASHVHYTNQLNFESTCTGSMENPTAPSGELCVYLEGTGAENAEYMEPVSSTAGVNLTFQLTADPGALAGSWAVTG